MTRTCETTGPSEDDFARRDRIEIAVRALTGAGLLHAHGQFLFATRAAVRADELKA
jgi:hypothetical protein